MRILSLILLLLFSSPAFGAAEEEEAKETEESKLTGRKYFLQHQLGANQGVYSIGLGYQGKVFEPSLSFGYVPPIHRGAEVTQANIKTNWKLLSLEKADFQWLIGASLLINSSANTFFEVPKKYPRRYYPPNAYYFAIQTTVRHHGFYVEASVIDYYLEVAANNKNTTGFLSKLVSLGFGYAQPIDFNW